MRRGSRGEQRGGEDTIVGVKKGFTYFLLRAASVCNESGSCVKVPKTLTIRFRHIWHAADVHIILYLFVVAYKFTIHAGNGTTSSVKAE